MTRSVAIIGLGSRGLGVLERIVALAGTEEAGQIIVHVVDPSCTGAGVHDTSQPDYLLLNTTCGQVSMFPGPLSVGAATAASGPNLHEWALERGLRLAADGFTVGPAGRELQATDFLPRRLLGEYLSWFYQQLKRRLPDHVRLVEHRSEAVDIDTGPAGLVITLADGAAVAADSAFLTTGYTPNASPPDPSTAAPRLITEPYPLPERLAAIAPGQTVAIGGFGLSAMDAVSCLTVGRGGRFRRDQGDIGYEPSGREPRIVMYSRSGVPCRARPLVTRFEVSYDPLVFTPASVDALRDRRGGPGTPLDFDADVMPLIRTEMRIAYRRAQARCAGPDAEQALVKELRSLAADPQGALGGRLDELDAVLGPFDAAAAFAGSAGLRLDDGPAYQRGFADTLRRDLGEGLLGFAWSPVKAALDIVRELRDTVRYVADFGGLTAASAADFYRFVVPLMNRAVVGPQWERHAELLALMSAGLVQVPLGPAPIMTRNGTGWTLSSTALAVPARRDVDWLLPAQVPLPAAEESASPLLRALAASGWIRRSAPGSRQVPGLDVDRDQHPLGADGTPHRRIWVLGPLCEGATFYNNLVPSPGVYSRPMADAHRCAAAMLAARPAPPRLAPARLPIEAQAVQVGGRDLLRHHQAPPVDEQFPQFVTVQHGQPGPDPVVPLVAAQRHHELVRVAGDQRGPFFFGETEAHPLLVRRDRGVHQPSDPELGVVPDQVLGGPRQRQRDLAHVVEGRHGSAPLAGEGHPVSLTRGDDLAPGEDYAGIWHFRVKGAVSWRGTNPRLGASVFSAWEHGVPPVLVKCSSRSVAVPRPSWPGRIRRYPGGRPSLSSNRAERGRSTSSSGKTCSATVRAYRGYSF
jgi:uncharacterized NAD(P)/FAD-binding protein YdhS